MRRKQIILFILIIICFIFWLARSQWLTFLIALLPQLERKANLFQGLDAIVNLILLVANGFLTFLLWISEREKNNNGIEEKKPLRTITPEKICNRLGYGGKVEWVNRDATKVADLRAHRRVIIIGRMKIGKTREAAELIKRAISEDLIQKEFIYEPKPSFRFLDKENLLKNLRQNLDTQVPHLLFIDDLPRFYFGAGLEQLTEALAVCNGCKASYVISVARSDQLSQRHNEWLKNQRFHIINLQDLDVSQTSLLIKNATNTFGLNMDKDAPQEFIAKRDGTPELILMSLRRLREERKSHVDKFTARRIASISLSEMWLETRRYVQEQVDGGDFILEALATFHAAGVEAHTSLIQHYATYLYRRGKILHRFWRMTRKFRHVLDVLSHYDVVQEGRVIAFPEIIVEGLVEPENAINQLSKFLNHHRWFIRRLGIKRLYKNSDIHLEALLSVYIGKKWVNDYRDLHISIQEPSPQSEIEDMHAMKYSNLHLSICGHAKHGKSTLAGRLTVEMEGLSTHLLDMYHDQAQTRGKDFNKFSMIFLKNQSISFSRRNGTPDDASRTVFPSRSSIKVESTNLTLIDTPGFSRYLDKIIYGIFLSDEAIVVVEATSGVSAGTETVCRILKAFEVPIIVFCITKMDLVNYSRSRFEEVKDEIMELLINVHELELNIPIVPVSALKGPGVSSQSQVKESELSWYQDDNLVHIIRNRKKEKRLEKSDRVRLAVEGSHEIFALPGVGTMLVGSLEAGKLKTGDILFAEPCSSIRSKEISAKIKSIHIAKSVTDQESREVEVAEARSIIAINVPKWKREDAQKNFRHGGILSVHEDRPSVAKKILATILFFEQDAIFFDKKFTLSAHVSQTTAQFSKIIDNNKQHYNLMKDEYWSKSGEIVQAEIAVLPPLCIEVYSDFPRLSRFVIRENNKIVACGKCIEILEGT